MIFIKKQYKNNCIIRLCPLLVQAQVIRTHLRAHSIDHRKKAPINVAALVQIFRISVQEWEICNQGWEVCKQGWEIYKQGWEIYKQR